MKDVGRYRRIFTRLWAHREFIALEEGERLLAFYLLTGPQTNRIGLFAFSPGRAAEDLKLTSEVFGQRFTVVLKAFGWQFDAEARVLWIPSWWTFNHPDNPKVLIGNLTDLCDVPASRLVAAFAARIETLPETLHQTFKERISKRSGIRKDQRQ